MEIKVVVGDITEMPVDAIMVNLFEGVEIPSGATGAVDKALGGAISQLISQGEIKGKLNEFTVVHTLGKIKATRVSIAGLGKQTELTLDRVRGVMATGCRSLRQIGVKSVATICHGAGIGESGPERAAQAIVEGTLLGLYHFRRHQTKPAEEGELEQLFLLEREKDKAPALERGCLKGSLTAEAVNFARDLVNEPANFMTPTHLVQRAQEVAQNLGLEFSVLEREQMEELGMGAILGVAQGSRQPPKMIILTYKGDSPQKRALGLIGKGLTFDSGGINIKPSEGMVDMKGDMAGGAAVLAAISAIAQLKTKLDVTAIIPATENLPGGNALKPGDVLQAMNGQTIEVVNTDAEGRLILADALCYGRKLGLSPLVDVATLTGACHIALGDFCSGAFSNTQELAGMVIQAGAEAGECIWQMPMYEEYKEQNKSDIADIKNSGGRYGGAITAAQFLAEFTGDTPWVHLDIAGTFLSEKDRTYLVKGATGSMVRTLINLALNLSGEQGEGGPKQ